jgi:hypothetical protein
MHEALDAMRQAQRELLAKQDETLQFLHEAAEETKKVRSEAIALQKQAMARAKLITSLAIPAILACVAMLVYLAVKYRIF